MPIKSAQDPGGSMSNAHCNSKCMKSFFDPIRNESSMAKPSPRFSYPEKARIPGTYQTHDELLAELAIYQTRMRELRKVIKDQCKKNKRNTTGDHKLFEDANTCSSSGYDTEATLVGQEEEWLTTMGEGSSRFSAYDTEYQGALIFQKKSA